MDIITVAFQYTFNTFLLLQESIIAELLHFLSTLSTDVAFCAKYRCRVRGRGKYFKMPFTKDSGTSSFLFSLGRRQLNFCKFI